jgi:hypothetical protein
MRGTSQGDKTRALSILHMWNGLTYATAVFQVLGRR